MKSSGRKALATASLIVLAVLFVVLTMLSNTLLKGFRFDLTEGGLYSVSPGTERILESIDEPINLYFFFSEQASQDLPHIRTYATRVLELLQEFALAAGNHIRLQVIDPAPFSEDEDRAAEFGLQAVPVGVGGDNLYFGLAGTNAVDTVETIGFFQPSKEAFLEYDLAKMIHNLAKPNKPVIGILSSLPIAGGFDPASRRMTQPWVISSQIEQLFEMRSLASDLEAIDSDIDVLMLVHPRDLGEKTLYAIDQFVLGGGKALVFVDPHAEAQPVDPQVGMFADRGSADAGRLFAAWGLEFDPSQVVLDRRFALQVAGPGGAPVRHLAFLGLDQSALGASDVVTSQLASMNLGSVGSLGLPEDSGLVMEALAQSSSNAMKSPSEGLRMLTDPASLQNGFSDSGERYVLAARFQGDAKTAFADGPPDSEGDAASDKHVAESTQPVNLIVVADTDLLSDRLWVSAQDFFGQQIVSAWSNNGDFVVNALDNLTGSGDLISIRGRATSTRPFTRVRQLEQQADTQFRATEQQLQQRLEATEQKLSELQQSREDDGSLLLTVEQQEELLRFQEEKIAIRKELRQVQRNLDRDIESLGTTLKVINIILIPVLVSVVALVLAVLRNRRRRQREMVLS